MKKLFLLSALLIFACSYGQGEQLYADGTATDQDGNTFEWINYGTQDWAIENAEVVTYRDGTLIPQVAVATEWESLTTGAWCYYSNDPSKGKLYNWYAVMEFQLLKHILLIILLSTQQLQVLLGWLTFFKAERLKFRSLFLESQYVG
ncbi:fibrobacter succinogenes major paralogous domain-containing protein [Flavobacteriaceae bacterium]|nr:fibrobacter succinogenes major paralogous domain-containing protein [Flavobacteriaceae bacterium]MDC0118162.1 fibrobacter succinogenes major paralogous domain-containing protein [bacterium]